jgi:MarR-like DNA-binding transcriptional regulator SgrR of sgrS sRNA
LLLVIGVILPACRNDETPAQSVWKNGENALHFDVNSPFGTLYPPGADAGGATHIFPLLCSYLCLPSPTGEMTPDLALRWEYDPTRFTWTFHLRSDARFHNGAPVTAHDVAHSFNAITKTLRPSLGKLVKEIRIPKAYPRGYRFFLLNRPGKMG